MPQDNFSGRKRQWLLSRQVEIGSNIIGYPQLDFDSWFYLAICKCKWNGLNVAHVEVYTDSVLQLHLFNDVDTNQFCDGMLMQMATVNMLLIVTTTIIMMIRMLVRFLITCKCQCWCMSILIIWNLICRMICIWQIEIWWRWQWYNDCCQ